MVTETWLDHADTTWSGSGTEDDPFLISSAEELAGLSYNVSQGNPYDGTYGRYFKQTSDIHLGGYEWVSIGTHSTQGMPFAGRYDGDNYVITGIFINSTNAHQGLFGDISDGAIIKNVVVKNSTIITTNSNAGAIVGTLDGGSSMIINCHSNAKVYGKSSIGGLVGVAYHGSIINSSFNGYVEGNDVIGGISGYLRGSKIDKCFSNANIKCTTNDAGGIVGASEVEESSVVKCKFTGSVQGARGVAGIIGSIMSGVVNIDDVIVCGQICYVYTDTSEPGAYFGAMIGWDIGTNAILNNCSFVGDSNIAISPICVHNNSATSCFSIINRLGYYSSGDFSGWAIIAGMNDNLPLQKSFYHVAQFGEKIDAAWFSRQGYTKV